MNTEYVAWLVILVAVGAAVVAYLALGPVPEIPAAEPAEMPGWSEVEAGLGRAVDEGPAIATEPAPASIDQSSPVSTTEPGPSAPSGTSETP